MSMTPNEQRNRLLSELQSLQTLLNKTNLMDNDNQGLNDAATEQEIIPILQAVHEAAEMIPTLTEQPSSLPEAEQTEAPAQTEEALSEADTEESNTETETTNGSPYLAKDVIERLASQASAISEQIRKMESEGELPIAESQVIKPQPPTAKTNENQQQEQAEALEITADELPVLQQDVEPLENPQVEESAIESEQANEIQAAAMQSDSELEAPSASQDDTKTDASAAFVSEEQKQIIINELIEDMLPTLMKQLRARLSTLK